jgi:hypothetical protein
MKIKFWTKKSSMPEEPKHRIILKSRLKLLESLHQIFLTGSQRFDVATEDSDIDYVMMKTTYDAHIYPIIHGLDGIKEEAGSGTGKQDPTLHSSVKFEKYNFILVWEKDQFLAWSAATKLVENTFGPEHLKDKTRRVNLFHDIKMAVFNFLEYDRLSKDSPPL